MKTLALLLALPLMFSTVSKADTQVSADASHSYTCSLSGRMKGLNVAIGLGGEVIKGRGTLTCRSAAGNVTRTPVRLSLAGGGAGLEFSVIKRIDIRSADIQTRDPHYVMRSYHIGATAGGTLVKKGIDFDTAFKVNGDAKGEGFEVGLQGKDALGLGVHLYGMVFKVSALR